MMRALLLFMLVAALLMATMALCASPTLATATDDLAAAPLMALAFATSPVHVALAPVTTPATATPTSVESTLTSAIGRTLLDTQATIGDDKHMAPKISADEAYADIGGTGSFTKAA
jgi:hypothetical protein